MNKLFEMSRWGFMLLAITGLVFIYSCGGDDEEPEPEPIDPPSGLSYPATTVAVGTEGTISPTISGDAATFEITNFGETKDGDEVIVAVTVDSNTGDISIPMESTVGVYTIEVTATNSEGSTSGTAEITIGINDDFDPTGKNLIWKYFMNKSADVVLENLDKLDDELPPTFQLPVGWPGGADFVIDPTLDPEVLQGYLIFTGIQEAILQVPGDDACQALETKNGDTLLVIVNSDLTLSTVCPSGSIVEMGTSKISYADGGFIWTIDVVLQGVLPLQISIADAAIVEDYIDPLYPNWSNPSGEGGMYDAITGNVAEYQTVDDYGFLPDGLPTGFIYLDVDVVLEIME